MASSIIVPRDSSMEFTSHAAPSIAFSRIVQADLLQGTYTLFCTEVYRYETQLQQMERPTCSPDLTCRVQCSDATPGLSTTTSQMHLLLLPPINHQNHSLQNFS